MFWSPCLALTVTGCSSTSHPTAASAPVTPLIASSTTAVPSTLERPTPTARHSTTHAAPTTHAPATHALRTHAAPTPTRSTTHVVPPPSSVARVSGAPLVVLNPGHNGGNGSHAAEINRQVPAGFGEYKACDTTGTTTNAGYPEHAFNWDVTLRVRTILLAHGLRVALTRPDDSGVGPCVDQRATTGNQPGSVAVVSIHADGAPTADHGFHVCYDSRPPAGAATDAKSRRLSTLIHDSLARSSGLVPAAYIGNGSGYFPRDDLAGLNLATVPATFLEIGNMRNASDAATQSSDAGRQRIAQAVAAGILAYLGR